ncbi:MAG: M23 family metallopeptidase [Bacteroidales bacterium]|nr:M23 family metallopeptidase [Bacteroidales bacterium]
MKGISKKAFSKLTNKYRLIIYNDNTFEEVLSYKLTRWNVFMLASVLSIVLMGLVYLLIAYTPLKAYVIPDFPKAEERHKIIQNSMLVDSLQNQLRLYDQYINNIKLILNDNISEPYQEFKGDTTGRYKDLNFAPSKDDSLMRKQVEEEEAYNLNMFTEVDPASAKTEFGFFPPVRGIITNSYNTSEKHFATDIVAANDELITSITDGVVVFNDWTMETGYVIVVLHKKNVLSVYKHNKKILKSEGDNVKIGEAIAVMGNTGEFTTGPHLHFELWIDGKPVNPEDYILFQ